MTTGLASRIVDITTDGVHLSVERGFLSVMRDNARLGRIALDDIAALIVHAHGATYSANLSIRLAERGVPVVFCAANHTPIALLWPMDGHYEQGLRMQAQAAASKPLRKRLWRDLVRAKIRAQAHALEISGENGAPLRDMAKRVRSGDPDNLEAQAARRYWQKIMGKDFRRDRNAGGINACLNYGYMVLRAAMARSIIGIGLHPSLSIHHSSAGNALRLADDLMEPFRPLVDLISHRLSRQGPPSLEQAEKAALAAVTTLDMHGPKGASPVQNCLDRLAASLARIYLGERKNLELPGPPLPLIAGSG